MSRQMLLGLAFALTAAPAAGQGNRPVTVEAAAGHVVFADDGLIDHSSFGTRALVALTGRLTVGPELVYMRGPGTDRDLFLMGVVNFDVLRERRVTPYITAAAGIMFHSSNFGSWSDPAVAFGAGARVKVADAWFVGAEGRIGAPLHAGVGLSVGYRFGGHGRGGVPGSD